MHNYAASVRRMLDLRIEGVIRRCLVELGYEANAEFEELVDSLKKSANINRHEVELLPATEERCSIYRCAGYKLTILPAHAESSLGLRTTGQPAENVCRICREVEAIEIRCPMINYSLGQPYLACDTAGACMELARLCVELEKQFNPELPIMHLAPGDEKPWLLWDNGILHFGDAKFGSGRRELYQFSQAIKSELRDGMYEFAKNGGTR